MLCSLVEEIITDFPGLSADDKKNHVVKIPHFGTIGLRSCFASREQRRLTMLRFELGSPDFGSGAARILHERAAVSTTWRTLKRISATILLLLFLSDHRKSETGANRHLQLATVYDRIEPKYNMGSWTPR